MNQTIDYTAITEYKAKEIYSGQLGLTLPFGGNAQNAYTASPTISVGPGISSLTITNFGLETESAVALHTESEQTHFQQLVDAGWSADRSVTILVQKIILRGQFAEEVVARSDDQCDVSSVLVGKEDSVRPVDRGAHLCFALAKTKTLGCPNRQATGALNLGNNQCQYWHFQSLLSRLELAGVGIDVRHESLMPRFRASDECSHSIDFYKTQLENGIDQPQSKLECVFLQTEANLRLSQEKRERKYGAKPPIWQRDKCFEEEQIEHVRECLKKRPKTLRSTFEMKPRTVHEIVQFLGQVTESQLHANPEWTPSIPQTSSDKQIELVPLFVVSKGERPTSMATVAIEHEGRSYYIGGRVDEFAALRNSLKVFAYLRDRIDQVYSKAKLPKTNTLLLQ